MWIIENNDQGQKPEKRKDPETKTFQGLFMAEDCYFDKTGAIVRFGKSKQHSP
jgi:hypothetical protein